MYNHRDPYRRARDRYPWAYPPTPTRGQHVLRVASMLGSLLLMTCVLAGLPWLLRWMAGWPPVHVPHDLDSDQIRWFVTSGAWRDPRHLAQAFAVIGWICWALLVLDTCWTALDTALCCARARPMYPTVSPVRAATRVLVGVLLGVILTVGSRLTGSRSTAGSPVPQPAITALAASHPATMVDAVHGSAPPSPTATGNDALAASEHSSTHPTAARTGPPAAHTAFDETGSRRCYVVHPGDTLWDIAARQLGNPQRWHDIYAANRGRPQPDGAALADPDLIRPGWQLLLPTHEAVRPPQPATHPPVDHATPTPAPSQIHPSPDATLNTPAHSPGASHTPTAVPAEQQKPHADPHRILGLPSGSQLSYGLAGVLLAALTTAAVLRRRHSYRPHPPGDAPDHHAPSPMPPLVHELQEAIHRDEADSDEDSRDQPEDQHPPAPPGDDRLPRRTDPLPPRTSPMLDLAAIVAQRPVHLTGPGAQPAVRALLASYLIGSHRAHVVITATHLQRLLGDANAVPRRIPRLTITDTLGAALTALDAALIERHHTGQATESEKPTPGSTGEHSEDTVLFTADPLPADLKARTSALLAQEDISAVFLITDSTDGSVLAGESAIHIDAHGTLHDPHGQACGTGPVDLLSTDDLRTVLEELSGDQPDEQPPAARHGHSPVVAAPPQSPSAPPQPSDTPPRSTSGTAPARGSVHHDRHSCAPGQPRAQHTTVLSSPARRAQVNILGTLAVTTANGDPIPGLRTRAGEILTYLALRRRTGADTDELLTAVMSGLRRAPASKRLYTDLANLRGILATAAGDTRGRPGRYVLRTQGRYRLDAHAISIDLWALQDSIRRAATSADPTERATALQDAVDAYHGDLAPGIDHLWATDARETALRDALDAATTLADHYANHDPHRALRLLRQAITWSPYTEELYRQIMRLHASLGDADAIRTTLHAASTQMRTIDRELNTETRDLATALITQLHAARPPAASG